MDNPNELVPGSLPSRRAATTASLVALCCGCSPETGEPISNTEARVLSSELGRYFDYAFVPAPSFDEWSQRASGASVEEIEDRWRTELEELGAVNHASGSLTGAALDLAGEEMFVAEDPSIPLRYSCGATLISPSLAITAAHCIATDTGPSTLQMYRPTTGLAGSVGSGLALSGSWPDFTHDILEPEDGYQIDEYPCDTYVRCDTDWGPLINCPFDDDSQDVAIVRCDGAPGVTYGFTRLAPAIPEQGTPVFVPWKHEVFDLDASSTDITEISSHYVQKGVVESNYHYFGGGRNQLLPLRSRVWDDGAPRTVAMDGWTDVMGCHGISGSGVLARDVTGYRLWGIMTSGSSDLTELLCHDTDERLADGQGPGSSLLGSNWLELDALVAWIAPDLASDCVTQLDGEATLSVEGSPLDGSSYRVPTWFSNVDCQAIATSASAPAPPFPLEAEGGAGVELDSGEGFTVGSFVVTGGVPYRLGIHVTRETPCADECTRGQLSADGAPASSFAFSGADGLVTSAGLSWVPSGAGSVNVLVENDGDPSGFVGPTLLREGQANSFDTAFDRMSTSLFAVTPGGAFGPAPARFTGDGVAGFSALLAGSERLLFTRQALLPGRRWTVRIEASNTSDLSCGFVDGVGQPLITQPCHRAFELDATAVPSTPSAFYVETSANSGLVEIDAVALASDFAADEDADGIADVLDGCPGVYDPEEGTECFGGDAGSGETDGGAPVQVEDGGRAAPRTDAGSAPSAGGAGAESNDGGEPGDGALSGGGGPNGAGGRATAGAPADPPDAAPPANALDAAAGPGTSMPGSDVGGPAPGATGTPAPTGEAGSSHSSSTDAGRSAASPAESGCACTAGIPTARHGAFAAFSFAVSLLLVRRRDRTNASPSRGQRRRSSCDSERSEPARR